MHNHKSKTRGACEVGLMLDGERVCAFGFIRSWQS